MRWTMPLILVACGPKNVRDVLGMAPTTSGNRVAVLAPVVLSDLEQPDDDMASFRAGTWVGTVWMSGGFEILEAEQNQVRSVNLDLADAEIYREQALRWVQDVTSSGAQEAGWTLVTPTMDVAPGAPERRPIRGTVRHDGDDNVNLPRFDLAPAALAGTLPVQGADAVLVPLLVHYYAHNSGWFIGQEGGTWAGARIRLLWALYRPDGTLSGWGEVGTKAEMEELASPNRQQLQDLLLEAEGEAKELLTRQLQGDVKGKKGGSN